MKNILCHSIYSPDPWGHGGEKRNAQIVEICRDAELEPKFYNLSKAGARFSAGNLAKALALIVHVYSIKQFGSLRIFLRFWKAVASQYHSLSAFFEGEKATFIWQSTKDKFYYLPSLAKKKHMKVIAVPHNLESLVPLQPTSLLGRISNSGFQTEIKALKKCDAVFAISREETLLLKLFGVNAFYLPYYPTRAVEKYLLSIRNRRKQEVGNRKKQILLLGSVVNPPTQIGMENRIKFFIQNKFEHLDLHIAGFGSEKLQSLISNTPNIHLLGELSAKQFEQELLLTDALLIYQPASTGALTRIIEFLIAGIPVLLNEESARSYFGMDGLWVYENDVQLIEFLQHDFNEIIALPKKPLVQYLQFQDKMTEYMG